MDMSKYHEISKLYQQVVESITTYDLGQLKLYFVNLSKRIESKSQEILAQYHSLKHFMDSIKQAKGKVPLHFAAARGEPSIFHHLIDCYKLDYTIKDQDGNTPYFTALQHGHYQLVTYFIQELSVSVNTTKPGEITGLHVAASHNYLETLKYLVEKGADIEKVSINGKPLNWAVGSRQLEATKFLLEAGADPNGDLTCSVPAPLILAIDFGAEEIYYELIKYGAKVDVRDPAGYTLLHVAAEKGDLATVKDLVERKLNIDEEVEGKSALYLAFEHERWDVVNYLKDKSSKSQETEETIQANKKQAELDKEVSEENKNKSEEIKAVGNKLYADKKYQQALERYSEAVDLNRTNEILHRNMAACFLALNDYEKALQSCRLALKKDSRNVKSLYRQAQAYIGLGNLVEAAADLWECATIEPSNGYFRAEFQKIVKQAKEQHQAKQEQRIKHEKKEEKP